MKPLRTFIAIDLSAATKTAIAGIMDELKKTNANVKWVEPENCHLTLSFLGKTPADKISMIQSLMTGVAAVPAFKIRLEQFKIIPNLQRPRVLLLSITSGADMLKSMADRINQQLPELGFHPEEREFSAHVTLGRFRSPKGSGAIAKILKAAPVSLEEAILELTFFKSHLTSSGPIYQKISSSPLTK